jgi:hypothetical protein
MDVKITWRHSERRLAKSPATEPTSRLVAISQWEAQLYLLRIICSVYFRLATTQIGNPWRCLECGLVGDKFTTRINMFDLWSRQTIAAGLPAFVYLKHAGNQRLWLATSGGGSGGSRFESDVSGGNLEMSATENAGYSACTQHSGLNSKLMYIVFGQSDGPSEIDPRFRSLLWYLWNQITTSLCNILTKTLSREFITLNISVSIK